MRTILIKCGLSIQFIFIFYSSFTQIPEIEWQNTIGSTQDDWLTAAVPTSDGGYIISGYSYGGSGGDKTESKKGENDFWIIKLDNSGNIVWQNTIQGNMTDKANVILQSGDGGYFIAGQSLSTDQFDKTEASNGFNDIWIVKLDAAGNIVWQNTIGGNSDETPMDAIQTADGGYIILAFSVSGMSGDKSESSIGNDVWVIKVDATGNVVWDNTINGNALLDYGNTIIEDTDGNFILGCSSMSTVAGDKTAINKGFLDYWIIKINGEGDILSQQTYGGTSDELLQCILPVSDGGYICAGYSTSNAGADKTENGFGQQDYWVIKIDAQNNIEWDKTFGGNSFDYLKSVVETPDGGFIFAGHSSSGISGNKTLASYGSSDIWLIKTDAVGNILWQDAIGGSGADPLLDFRETSDGGYILGSFSDSGISGDKTEARVGQTDYWVIKLTGETCIPETEICNFLDDDCNGIVDDGLTESISISAAGSTLFCQGGSVLLSATYSGATVQWEKNGADIAGATSATYSAIKSGDYTCVTTSPCGTATSDLIHVTVNKNPLASITAGGATTFCAGGSVTLTEAPVTGCSYQWYKGASPITGATSVNYIATTAGNYKCRVTKTASGCFKNSNTIVVTVPCKEGEMISDEADLHVFPNPNNGTFTIISAVKGKGKIQIINALGQIIYTEEYNTQNELHHTISLPHPSPGIYIVRVLSEMGIYDNPVNIN